MIIGIGLYPAPLARLTRRGSRDEAGTASSGSSRSELHKTIPQKGQLLRRYGPESPAAGGDGLRRRTGSSGLARRARTVRSSRPGGCGVQPISGSEQVDATARKSAWARLPARVYEVDPLGCPECGLPYEVRFTSETGGSSARPNCGDLRSSRILTRSSTSFVTSSRTVVHRPSWTSPLWSEPRPAGCAAFTLVISHRFVTDHQTRRGSDSSLPRSGSESRDFHNNAAYLRGTVWKRRDHGSSWNT